MPRSISIVIPVYNDADNLNTCLQSIYDGETSDFEVIVVDDASEPSMRSITDQFSCKYIGLPFNKGQAYARNYGVRESSGEIILFTDSDCIVMKNWANLMAQSLISSHHESSSVTAICGQVRSDKGFVEMSHAYTGYAYVQGGDCRYLECLNTSCAALYKENFWKVGGFSEEMRMSGEDQDLAMKLIESGSQIIFEPKVWVTHNHGIHTFRDMVTKHQRWGRTLGLTLMKKHPEQNKVLLSLLNFPFIHFLLIVPLAFATAVKIVLYNFGSDKKVWIYFPTILINKIAYRWGIFVKSIEPMAGINNSC